MNNYTVTTFSSQIAAGGSAPGTVVLQITPDPGYVVSASDFGIGLDEGEGGALPAEIESASFSDTTQPGAIGNIVECTLTVSASFVMPSENTTINVDIDGIAQEWVEDNSDESNEVDVQVDIIIRIPFGGTLSSFPGGDETTTTKVLSDDSPYGEDVIRVTGTGLKRNVSTLACRLTVTADSGYILPRAAYLVHSTVGRSLVSTREIITLKLVDTTVYKGRTTEMVYDVFIRPDDNYSSLDSVNVAFVNTVKESLQLANEITGVTFGKDIVNFKGETRSLVVYGRQGANFSLSITRDSDNADLITPIDTAQIPVTSNRPKLQGSYELSVDIPSIDTGSESYTILVTPEASTSLGADVPVSGYVLNQYVNPTLTLSTSTTQAFDLPDDIVVVGEPFKTGSQLDYKRDFEQLFDFSMVITATAGNQLQKLKSAAFDNVLQVDSDWSNSVPDDNGGTYIFMNNIVTKNLSATEISITGTVFINIFGGSDVTMTLDLDSIIFEKPL